MRENDDSISKLLRLKRYEQPPPEYFENFLHEFHRRQRIELLKRSAWRIAFDRIEALFNHISSAQLSYATASFAVLAIAALVTVKMLQHPGVSATAVALNGPSHSITLNSQLVASASPASSRPVGIMQDTQTVNLVPPTYAAREFTLVPQIRFPGSFQNQVTQPGATSLHPRYILDTRPASYEPPFSF